MYFHPAHVIWYSDLQKLVKDTYGVDINIMDMIPDEFRGQNTYHEVDVNGESELDCVEDPYIVKHWIETGEYQYINEDDLNIPEAKDPQWWSNDYYFVEIKHILHRLFKDGLIPGGKWIVTVWW